MNEFILNTGSGHALMTLRSPSSLSSAKHTSKKKKIPSLPSISRTDSKSSLKSSSIITPRYNEEVEKKLKNTQLELEELKSELFRMKTDSSRQSILMKSYQNSESLFTMNWEDLDVFELRKTLLNLVSQTHEVYRSMQNRCNVLSLIIKYLQEEPNSLDSDSSQLISIIQELSDSLDHTTQTELELGLKSRELAKKILEVSQIRYRFDALNKRFLRNETERKELSDKFKRLQEDHSKLLKTNTIEKQRFQQISAKIQSLEEALWVMTSGQIFNSQDTAIKLKGSIHTLLKEVQDHKKEILELKKDKDVLEITIVKLTKRINRMTLKLNEIKNRQALLEEINHSVDNSTYKRNMFDARTVPYRIFHLKHEERAFLNDIIDHGHQGITSLSGAILQEPNLIECLVDQFLQLNELVEHFTVVPTGINYLSECNSLQSLIFKVYNDLPSLMNAEFCHYWICDKNCDEIWTSVIKDEEIRLKSSIGFHGYAISEGTHLNIKDCRNHPKFNCQVEEALGHKYKTLLMFPIYDSNQHLLGLLECVNSTAGMFEHDDEFLAETFLPLISSITQRTLHKAAGQAIDRMKDSLISASLNVFNCTSLNQLIITLEESCKAIFSVTTARVILYRPHSFLKLTDGTVQTVDSDVGICGKVLESRKSMLISSPYTCTMFNSIVDIASTLPVVFYPINTSTDILGVLQIPYKPAFKFVQDKSVNIDKDLSYILDQFVMMISPALQRYLSS